MTWQADDTFSTFDVVNILGIKRVTLKNWIDEGFVKPTYMNNGRGPGKNSRFDTKAVCMIGAFSALVGSGFSRKLAASILTNDLHREALDDLAGG